MKLKDLEDILVYDNDMVFLVHNDWGVEEYSWKDVEKGYLTEEQYYQVLNSFRDYTVMIIAEICGKINITLKEY